MTLRTSRLHWAAGTGLALVLMAGCAGQDPAAQSEQDSAQTAAAEDLAPSQTIVNDAQASPTNVARAFFSRMAGGQAQGVCDLLEEAARASYTAQGISCAAAMGAGLSEENRALAAQVIVPEQDVDPGSDFVRVTVQGVDKDGDPVTKQVSTVRAYGVWFVVMDA